MWRNKSDILKPDPRFGNIVRTDLAAGKIYYVTIEDMYDDMAAFVLPSSIPDEIVRQFDLARNAYVYSWFDYEFVTLSEEHIYTVIELAIRRRARDENSGMDEKTPMRGAIDHARARGWLKDDDFGYLAGSDRFPILHTIPIMRNELMHGNFHLYPHGSLTVMKLCHQILISLFPPKQT